MMINSRMHQKGLKKIVKKVLFAIFTSFTRDTLKASLNSAPSYVHCLLGKDGCFTP